MRIAGTIFLCLSALACQAQEKSPESLVDFVTYRVEREPWQPTFTCGSLGHEIAVNRNAAAELAAMDSPALPAIQTALDSFEKNGLSSGYAQGVAWLFYSYARIEGPAAYPRLRKMMLQPGLDRYQGALTGSIALALGLTSYVALSGAPGQYLCRHKEPRDALDGFLFAWLTNDRHKFEESLGRKSRAALNSMLENRSWKDLRAEYLRNGGGNIAIGYRLEIAGRWSQPGETLQPDAAIDVFGDPRDPLIPVAFTDAEGRDCGPFPVKFLTPHDPASFSFSYLIDTPDLGNLLRKIDFCLHNDRSSPRLDTPLPAPVP